MRDPGFDNYDEVKRMVGRAVINTDKKHSYSVNGKTTMEQKKA